MPKLHLDWSDGRYSTRLLNDEEAAKCEELGITVAYVEDHVYETHLRDCERDSIWQALWRAISNEQSMRRREKELRPLEDAEREIVRLTSELASAQRLAKYFEDEWSRAQGIDPEAREHAKRYGDEYTCVYPQPGCTLDVLPEAWRSDAQRILDRYRPDRMEGGLKYQGCCCGHEHKLLDNAAAQILRDAGFLVENDTETV